MGSKMGAGGSLSHSRVSVADTKDTHCQPRSESAQRQALDLVECPTSCLILRVHEATEAEGSSHSSVLGN
jgi:hypothetical protein